MKLQYTVYQRTITTCMEGDREEQHGWSHGAIELSPTFLSLKDARAKVEEWSKNEKPVLKNTRYGIGSITRSIYLIEEWALDDNGEPLESFEDMNSEQIDILDRYPEIKQAWERAKQSYYRFLDYEDDYFCSVNDLLESE